MIGFQPITSGSDAARYHDKAFVQDGVVQGADNYYTDRAAKSSWQGLGAQILGVEGERVGREDFVNYLNGKITNPETGEIQDLTRNGNQDRRGGYDLTIAPPKSVSVMALVGGDERLIEAHEAANQKAMEWLQEHAAHIRIKGEDGQNVTVSRGNLLWATIQHETNRNNEPQLHNHNVLMAVVYDDQAQKWRSLTNDELLNLRKAADHVYKAELAHGPRGIERLGYELVYDKNGLDFELAALKPAQIQAFSTRKEEIDAAIRARGFDPETASWEMRQAATLDTRAAKAELPSQVLHEAWKEVLTSAGMSREGLQEIIDASKNRQQALQNAPAELDGHRLGQARLAVLAATDHLATREQAFTTTDLEYESIRWNRAPIDLVKLAIDEQRGERILLDRAGLSPSKEWLTTPKAVMAEETFLEQIRAGKAMGNAPIQDAGELKLLMDRFEARKSEQIGAPFKLSTDQVNAVTNLLMHPDQFQAIQGNAGTGKTAGLEFVREALESKGSLVMGVAATSSAAEELAQATGMKANTIAGFFAERQTAMRTLQLELQALEQAIGKGGYIKDSELPAIEVRTLEAKGMHKDFGRNRYTFDRQAGAVYKADKSLGSIVGAFLADSAEKARERLSASGAQGQSFGQRFMAQLQDKAGSLGERLISYQRVGAVEARAATRELLTIKRSERMAELQAREKETNRRLNNLQAFGNIEGKLTTFVMDETSMTDAASFQKFVSFVSSFGANARGVLQGDVLQHDSVGAGRVFMQAQTNGLHTSVLSETRRFDRATPQTKAAAKLVYEQQIGKAYAGLDRKEVANEDLAKTVGALYVQQFQELRDRGVQSPAVAVVALTNADRIAANREVREGLQAIGIVGKQNQQKEHFTPAQLTPTEALNPSALYNAGVDRLVFNQPYQQLGIKSGDTIIVGKDGLQDDRKLIIGTNERTGEVIRIDPEGTPNYSVYKSERREFSVGDLVETRSVIRLQQTGETGASGKDSELLRLANGRRGVVVSVDGDQTRILWQRKGSVESVLDNRSMRYVDHAYAHTSIKDQGATYDNVLVMASKTGAKIVDEASALVAVTRARLNTMVVTSDWKSFLKNVSKSDRNTTAIKMDEKPYLAVLFKGTDKSQSEESAEKARQAQQRQQDLDRVRQQSPADTERNLQLQQREREIDRAQSHGLAR